MTVLVIDDEPLVRRALRRAAEARGHHVIEAVDGEQGLTLWQQSQPQIVFLDVLMPRLSGPEVLKKIAGTHQSKVVLISAYSGEYNLETAKCLGADLFIPKPFDNIFSVIEMAEGLVSGK